MDINLEQCLASVVRYIQLRAKNSPQLYFDDLPENFVVPSLYFPIPRSTSRRVTLQSWLTKITMEVWFMASTDWLAYADAVSVRDCILQDECAMDIMERDGTVSGKMVRITEPQVITQGTGIVKLSFSVKDYFAKGVDQETKANKIYISGSFG